MSQDIVKIWMVKFAKPLVIHQGFSPPKICTIRYLFYCNKAIHKRKVLEDDNYNTAVSGNYFLVVIIQWEKSQKLINIKINKNIK